MGEKSISMYRDWTPAACYNHVKTLIENWKISPMDLRYHNPLWRLLFHSHPSKAPTSKR
jgi:hypothetical protein